jgi:hypothetical protein
MMQLEPLHVSGSPRATVAASALHGVITDPREVLA